MEIKKYFLKCKRKKIQLTATDLVNANSIKGFGTNIQSNQIFYVVIGPISNGTYYLTPGNITGSSLNNACVFSLPYSQKTILYSMTAYYSIPILSGDSTIINLYNTTIPGTGASGTNIVTTTLNNSNSGPIRLQNFASTFIPTTNYLQVQIITNGMNAGVYNNHALFITLSLY